MEDVKQFEDFQTHLQTLSGSDWESLFRLIPELEQAQSFGNLKHSEQNEEGVYTMPYWVATNIVDKTLQVIIKLKLYPVFDWGAWKGGQAILNADAVVELHLDTLTLCKLLTVMIRSDRFCEGYLIGCFQRGVVLKILNGLQRNIQGTGSRSQNNA